MKTTAIFIFLLFLFPSIMMAGFAAQTDWSGGDGISGPVIDWGNEFYTGTDVECYSTPSNLTLLKLIEEHRVCESFVQSVSVFSADVNGDGYMDILGAGNGADEIAWWENVDGSGTSWTMHTVDGDFNGANSVYSVDVNGDGYMDILGAATFANDIAWWENIDGSGTSWSKHTIDFNFDWAWSVFSADVNGDGYMDVLGAGFYNEGIVWWENVGGSGTSWTAHGVSGSFDGARSVFSADVNGDGYMDVLGADNRGNSIIWWENVGGSGIGWTTHTVDGNFDGATSVFSSDVNDDGYMDILGAANGADDITWWENVDGSGTSWTMHTVDGDFNGAQSVYSADVNGDGYMDILGTASEADAITWWENVDGSGTSWTEHPVDGSFDGAWSVFSADVNGDGQLDILGAAYHAYDIIWWDLNVFISNGSLESSVLEVQESPAWQTIDWNCIEPSGTSVAFQVRSSDNSASMGAWSDTLVAPCILSGILADEDNYFQYRVILTSTDLHISPLLEDVLLTWQPYTGIEEESSAFALYGASQNPVVGAAVLGFSLPEDSWIELTVYDLSGRMVDSICGEFESGVHEVVLDDLSCGVYLARMISEEFTASQQFVVIK